MTLPSGYIEGLFIFVNGTYNLFLKYMYVFVFFNYLYLLWIAWPVKDRLF